MTFVLTTHLPSPSPVCSVPHSGSSLSPHLSCSLSLGAPVLDLVSLCSQVFRSSQALDPLDLLRSLWCMVCHFVTLSELLSDVVPLCLLEPRLLWAVAVGAEGRAEGWGARLFQRWKDCFPKEVFVPTSLFFSEKLGDDFPKAFASLLSSWHRVTKSFMESLL